MPAMDDKPHNLAREFDEPGLSVWVEQCLEGRRDGEIVDAMTGHMNLEPSKVCSALENSFTEFQKRIGLRKYRVRLFAIPVSVRVDIATEGGNIVLDDVSGYINSFYTNGLVKRGGAGLVLLNTLVGHEDLEASPLSAMFELGHELFNCAHEPSRVMPVLGRIGNEMDETSWLPMPNGYFSMRYIMGVVFWSQPNQEPEMYQMASAGTWGKEIANRLRMQIMTLQTGHVDIQVGVPEMVFGALNRGTETMIAKAMEALAVEAVTHTHQVEGVICVQTTGDALGRTELRCMLADKYLQEMPLTAMSVQLSVVESLRINQHIQVVTRCLEEHAIPLREISYDGSTCSSAKGGTRMLH